ncbi:MAG: 6-phosphogluconolactonase [Chloroflexi bacterium]|nr:6-phosphogluconolactonase [Chloroflexota bacterium]
MSGRPPAGQLQVYPDPASLARAAAELFQNAAAVAVRARGTCSVALSGGSTPRAMLQLLAEPPFREAIGWSRLEVFWGDERCVPPEDERSNYRMASEALLSRVPVPGGQVHRMRGEADDLAAAASEYEAEIRRVVPAWPSGVPALDLVLLGLGADGHTASLLPGSRLIAETERLVAVTDARREGTTRLTFTAPLILKARTIAVLVAGPDKAEALDEVLHGPDAPERYPAQLLRARSDVCWLVDAAAASGRPRGRRGMP